MSQLRSRNISKVPLKKKEEIEEDRIIVEESSEGDESSDEVRIHTSIRPLFAHKKEVSITKKGALIKIIIALKAANKEPEIEIKLTTLSSTNKARVKYNFRNGQYEPIPDEELIEDLLTLNSKTLLKEELHQLDEDKRQREQNQRDLRKTTSQEDEDFEGIISKEELRKLDSQPNPFNYSDRVSQTSKIITVDAAIQTDPPPSTSYCLNIGLSDIYDAYQKDYEKVLKKELEKEMEKEREKDRSSSKPKSLPTVGAKQEEKVMKAVTIFGEEIKDIKKLAVAARTLERMVSQNIYDEITLDFKYWEDGSDEFHPLEGSLLPLWKFSHDTSRGLIISSVSWSPIYPDLFAAAYRSGDITGGDGTGMVCLFTLKNPSAPERIVNSKAGVTAVEFHPRIASVLCAGCTDGVVVIYDVRSVNNTVEILSTAVSGKHLLPVCQVRWIKTEPGEDLSFFSVSMDGRVTQWFLHCSTLIYTDLLNFHWLDQQISSTTVISMPEKVNLEGCGTCIAFKPDDESVILVGCDTGAVFQCTTAATTHDLTKYDAHTSRVRAVSWNHFNYKVFASCAIDWTIKIWVEYHDSPLVVLDIGGPVADISWSPCSSTVLVASTDEGRIHVFDLFLRKCRPLCIQNVTQRKKLSISTVKFSPCFPVILVGGTKGHLVTMKLSPNLRKLHKDAKGGDEQRQNDVEIAKMDRLIAISKAQT